jgi:hypothetical protein
VTDRSDLIATSELAAELGRSVAYVCQRAVDDARYRNAKVRHGQFSRSSLRAAGILAASVPSEDRVREIFREEFLKMVKGAA